MGVKVSCLKAIRCLCLPSMLTALKIALKSLTLRQLLPKARGRLILRPKLSQLPIRKTVVLASRGGTLSGAVRGFPYRKRSANSTCLSLPPR